MMKKALNIVSMIAVVLEDLLAVLVAIAAVAAIICMIPDYLHIMQNGMTESGLSEILENVLAIAVALEFLKMLLKPNTRTVIEVLIFLIARHMIILETTPQQDLLSVISIAILLSTRYGIENLIKKHGLGNVDTQNDPQDSKED
ncbi:MAG: phosphate-starvation-inducible PsiE family protein [Lachnospiraceae bacterium]|jgi:uncharacterized membrane protein (DUF373 family)|nr:phosphate-starvation-inducible PsiE family protein [Lachnospiraceae bacterium]MDD7702541.1 phosphate-starvation-inducible PsiE family protein [Lachnospiraceae bacterium]MDY3302004.1 phosphate-starvation-inducible PsiE family protein [Lachnospiraceae bacterium]